MELRKSLEQRATELEQQERAPTSLAESLANELEKTKGKNDPHFRALKIEQAGNLVTLSFTNKADVLRVRCFGADSWTMDDRRLLDQDAMMVAVLKFIGMPWSAS
jgi:hypothetical protein